MVCSGNLWLSKVVQAQGKMGHYWLSKVTRKLVAQYGGLGTGKRSA